MSSRRRLRGIAVAVCALAPAALVGGCGSDEEPARQSAERPHTSATTPTASSVPTEAQSSTESTAPKRSGPRKHTARKPAGKDPAGTQTATAPPATSEQPTPAPSGAQNADQPTRQPPARTKHKPPAKRRPKADPGPPAHSISESATLQLVSKQGARAFVYEGSVQGTLPGQMHLDTKIGGKGVISTFTVTLTDGTLSGRGSARLALGQSQVRFSGTVTITGGTGVYEGASGSGLKFSGSVSSDASTCKVKMSGDLRY